MIPILSSININVTNLPTALVSNSFDYGKFAFADLSDYFQETVKVWKELKPQFNYIVTGFFTSKMQIDCIKLIIGFQNEKPTVICDPILGDNGKFYNSNYNKNLEIMKKMIPISDILLPNTTEITFLLGEKYKVKLNDETAKKWFQQIQNIGAKSIIITNMNIDNLHCVLGFD